MKNNRGLFRRDGALIKCELSRSDTYSDVVEKLSDMKSPSKLCLYRPYSGAQEFKIDVIWTLGYYMRVKHAGPELGIGRSGEVSSSSEEASSGEVTELSDEEVNIR